MIKQLFKKGTHKVPHVVINKLKTGYVIGGAVLITGIALAVLTENMFPLLVALGLSLVLFFFAYTTYLEITRVGLDILDGEVVKVDYGAIPHIKASKGFKREPKRFIIRDYCNIQYALPYNPKNPVSEGDKVRAYIKKKSQYLEIGSNAHPTEILAYEVFYGGLDNGR